MFVTPPRSSVEMDVDALRLTKIDLEDEDFVKQDFPVSDDRVIADCETLRFGFLRGLYIRMCLPAFDLHRLDILLQSNLERI